MFGRIQLLISYAFRWDIIVTIDDLNLHILYIWCICHAYSMNMSIFRHEGVLLMRNVYENPAHFENPPLTDLNVFCWAQRKMPVHSRTPSSLSGPRSPFEGITGNRPVTGLDPVRSLYDRQNPILLAKIIKCHQCRTGNRTSNKTVIIWRAQKSRSQKSCLCQGPSHSSIGPPCKSIYKMRAPIFLLIWL